ncbi:hypothetical protein [Massilia sp. METH4]|uniref:hypothetical protein n=1 Tax=Massilia sp. METH4 TaxID=3123041 RepID=UPI0030CBAA75
MKVKMDDNEKCIRKEFFPDLDDELCEKDVSNVFGFISLFDHVLTEREAGECQVMSYSMALENGHLDTYLAGERKFVSLYTAMARAGVLYNHRDGVLRLDSQDPGLIDVFVRSLREQEFMDVYFLASSVRLVGGYDRADMVVMKKGPGWQELALLVADAGLALWERRFAGVAQVH